MHECWQAAARKSSGTAVMRKVGCICLQTGPAVCCCQTGLAGWCQLDGDQISQAAAGCGGVLTLTFCCSPLPNLYLVCTPAVDCCCSGHKLSDQPSLRWLCAALREHLALSMRGSIHRLVAQQSTSIHTCAQQSTRRFPLAPCRCTTKLIIIMNCPPALLRAEIV